MKLQKDFEQFQQIFNLGYRFNPDDRIFYTDNVEKFKCPEKYEDWKVQLIEKEGYLNERLKELDILPAEHKIQIKDSDGKMFYSQIFVASKYGDIDIIQYNIHRESIMKEGVT
ncbi:MAG: hypothetical protein ABI207_06135, partial [Crocinitomicaceae bacterium]